MLKSLQARLVIMFVLIILSVMIVVGTFLTNSVTVFYHEEFKQQMKNVFSPELVSQLNDTLNSKSTTEKMRTILDAYSGRIGVDSYRNYYILDGKTGYYIGGSVSQEGLAIDLTDNIVKAMNAETGDIVVPSGRYMDYAIPIPAQSPVQFVVYVRETKDEISDFIRRMFFVLLQALAIGVLISVILGYFLSKTITKPVKSLTLRAEKLAGGEFEAVDQSQSDDEIGILTNTFKYMSETLKASLEEIANEKKKLETIMQYMTDGVVAFDPEDRLLLINEAAKKYLGIKDGDNITFDSYFSPLLDEIKLGDFVYISSDKKLNTAINTNGYDLKTQISTFLFDSNRIGGVIVVVQDITEQEKLERSRREFVANVSHELRTPLTTIKSYIETLLSGGVDADTMQSFLNVVNKEADRMARLVTDLLTLSRLDSGMVRFNREFFDIGELIRDILERLSFEAKNRDHLLSFSPSKDLPQIYADRDKIEQIIINIISNAIKYTADGGRIDIYARSMYGNLYVRIKDNGIGIPEKDLSRIFERFYRVDKARSRELGGTGLGLAIAKEIISFHGGDITIESTYKKGTEVIIRLPLEKPIDVSLDKKGNT